MPRDLGDQNLTLLEQGKKGAAKAALDELQGDREFNAEVLTTGEIEVSADTTITKTPKGLGWLKGGTFTTFAKTKVQNMKDFVGGFRVNKKFLIAFAFMLVSAPALAQTATQVDRFTWGHTETAAVAQAFRFEIEIDGAAPVVLAGVTCTGAPTTCSARIPSVTPTQHVVRIRATDTTNTANPLVGPWSDPFTFTMRAVPSKPSAVGIIPGS